MIPFNYLGWVFKLFGKGIYPDWVFLSIGKIINSLKEKDYVLDIGSGTGILLEEAKKQNNLPTYVALDPAIGMLKFAPEDLVRIVGKAEKLPFKNNVFSLITFGESIHHIRDLDRAFREIYRVLKKDGYVFIFDFDPYEKKGKLIYRFEKLLGEPGNFFSPESLSEFLLKHGFVSEYIKRDYRYILIAKKS